MSDSAGLAESFSSSSGTVTFSHTEGLLKDVAASLTKSRIPTDLKIVLGGTTEEIHKFVLLMRSLEFRKAVTGASSKLNYSKDTITITDTSITSITLRAFLAFLYNPGFVIKGKFKPENFLPLIDLFDVPDLGVAVGEGMSSSVTKANVDSYWKLGRKYGIASLVTACLNCVGASDGYFTSSKFEAQIREDPMLVNDLLQADRLPISEDDLYRLVVKLAKKSLPSGAPRSELSKFEHFKSLRAPQLSAEFLATTARKDGFFSDDELIEALLFKLCPSEFVDRKEKKFASRGVSFELDRGTVSSSSTWYYSSTSRDGVMIKSDKSCMIRGVGLLLGSGDTTVSLTIYDKCGSSKKSLATSGEQKLNRTSKVPEPQPFMLKSPFRMVPGVWYLVQIKQNGPVSCSMSSGRTVYKVDKHNITFTFKNTSGESPNGTSYSSGQFPRFYFSL